LNVPFFSLSPTGQKGYIPKYNLLEKASEKFSIKKRKMVRCLLWQPFLKKIDSNWIFSVVKQQNAEGGN
jgi:hypothetical protein